MGLCVAGAGRSAGSMVGSSPLALLLQLAILVSSSLQEKGSFEYYSYCKLYTIMLKLQIG